MTAEQLEELLGKVTQEGSNGWWPEPGYDGQPALEADEKLIALAPSLARRVIAAEAMRVELEKCETMLRERGLLAQADASEAALTAYREAAK